ncbi:methionine synthase [Meiothermus sp.]|uniref:methionine synthase n=1 Tax=Meiothermus sp. TaxID=1955249 RepID=UPI0025D1183D|nr:methionine synthase [Meiothermus sp.]
MALVSVSAPRDFFAEQGLEPLTAQGYQRAARAEAFPYLKALSERVLVFDGAMGTEIFKYSLSDADYGGEQYSGCPEILNRTRPDVIAAIHRSYLEAGADVIETNTFGCLPHVLSEYGLEAEAEDLAYAAAQIARQVAEAHGQQPRFVAGALGPGTKLISLGQIGWRELFESYRTGARGLVRGGVDLLLIETCQDILQVRCAVLAARQAMQDVGREVPLQVQVTIEATGTMLVGTDDSAALTVLENLPVDVVGINCAVGPDLMDSHIRHFCQNSTRWVSCLPNAGLPRNEGGRAVFDLTPAELARWQLKFVQEYGLNAVGGCCGTAPEHIAALARAVEGLKKPAAPAPAARPAGLVASLYQSVPLRQETGILIVGERTNATGSKKFRELLFAGDFDGMSELAAEQVAEGAHVLDVSVAWTGRDEVRDMREVLKRFATSVPIPIMIDSTQPEVMEEALKHLGGRAILNSVNLEDGLEKFDRVAALAKRHGAALVALTIDEDKEAGMAKTVERKVEIALRMYERLTQVHGIPGESLLFDLLTFPITQGDEDTRKLALWTIEGIRRLRQELPEVGFILGVSNVSFGLSPQARVVLNSVFLDECIQAGLTAAILNAGKILPIHQIPQEPYRLALDLIYDRRQWGPAGEVTHDPLFAFVDYFAKHKSDRAQTRDPLAGLPLEERLQKRIIEGRKVGLEADLEQALARYSPVEIINKILLEGMKVVGDLFGAGKMQLPFVLQAAETMKAAVSYLEPRMEKLEGVHKGTMVLATVKGDVHDIGKNLVDIILSNNGYKVVNLGIKKPIEEILAAVEAHRPDAVGMSGLLVKSTVVMKENLEYMAARGYQIPVVLGGAALNRHYVENDLRQTYTTGQVYYASDAFDGLQIMEELTGHAPPRLTSREVSGHKYKTAYEILQEKLMAGSEYIPSNIPPAPRIPRPPFWGRRVVDAGELEIGVISRYVNKNALFRGQWGFRRGEMSQPEYEAYLERLAEPMFEEMVLQAMGEGWLEPAVVYGYWPVASDKNDLIVFDPDTGLELFRFNFPRQMGAGSRHLCIADFFRPRHAEPIGDEPSWFPPAAWANGARDVLAAQVVTMGRKVSQVAQELFKADAYQDYLYLHGFSVEMAEALAEYWHKRIRQQLGIAQDDATSLEELFRQGYQGSRYSFGYPACPRLEDQKHLQDLLQWQEIGVELSEEYQLHPEQSTSAIVAHHPSARYFNL